MNAKFSAKCVALIAAGAMSMSLAACSGGSMDDSSSSNGSAANSDTITLGSVTTNSGTAAAYGEAEVAGFKLAVDEINADGEIEDDYRIDFVRQHLQWIARAIEDGAKCRGYHYWAVIDNWSWSNAFKNRYGFVEVDLMDGYKRRLKKSAAWLKQVATTHVVD